MRFFENTMRDILGANKKTEGLPDASKFPYQLVRIIHWGRLDFHGTRKGVRRLSSELGWRSERNYNDVVTTLLEGESWEWDGFSIDSFNGGYYLFLKELDTPSEVLDSIRTLSTWLKGVTDVDGEF